MQFDVNKKVQRETLYAHSLIAVPLKLVRVIYSLCLLFLLKNTEKNKLNMDFTRT